jgi:hypothetical protein
MRWRVGLVWGALIEILIVSALALYGFGLIPPIVFGGVRDASVAFALHLPGSLLAFPILNIAAALGLSVIQSLVVAAVIVGALQAVVIGALTFGVIRYPKVSAAAALATLVAAFIATHSKPSPYRDGMDSNHDGLVSMEEWSRFHSAQPGYDNSGSITKGSADYYEREFKRVDCNYDLKMDAYEYRQLHWNMRWCESSLRPPRPWWE